MKKTKETPKCHDCNKKAIISITSDYYDTSFLCLNCFVAWLNDLNLKNGIFGITVKKIKVLKHEFIRL